MKSTCLIHVAFVVTVASCLDNIPPTATISSGILQGATTHLPGGQQVRQFLSIPYAERPELFELPKPPLLWKHIRDATKFGAACPQFIPHTNIGTGYDIMQEIFNTHPPESEDCLYINVFTSAGEVPLHGRPVVLFIPGGGWQMGSGITDLSAFAAYEDIVAVTFNWRTNVFGFPNSRDIPIQNRNLGLYDQRLAIRWLEENVAAFGGDPNRVTLWGQSAGSMPVDIHMHSYGRSGKVPFRAVIMFSGQKSIGQLSIGFNATEYATFDGVMDAANCSTLECMRKVPVSTLLRALDMEGANFMPVMDNITMPEKRSTAWKTGSVAQVPILAGTTAQEGRALIFRNITRDTFNRIYMPSPIFTPKIRDSIQAYYKDLPGIKSEFDALAALYTDLLWHCPQSIMANLSASHGIPVWQYYLNFSAAELLPSKFSWLDKFHGIDIILLFLDQRRIETELNARLYTLLATMRSMIGKFVRNPTGGPGWPAIGQHWAPYDIGTIGDVGDTVSAGITPANRSSVDERCLFFKDIYRQMEDIA